MNDAINTLRAMYRNVRAHSRGEIHGHSPFDHAAFVDAILDVAADGGDTWKIMRAFEALGYWTRLDILGHSNQGAARVKAAKAARGWRGAIKVASLLGLSDVWNAAMNAHFGPLGTHESRRGSDGVPTVETMAEFPRIGEFMAEGARMFDNVISYHERFNTGEVNMSHVVGYRAPAKAA